jgi:hypothetical protein
MANGRRRFVAAVCGIALAGLVGSVAAAQRGEPRRDQPQRTDQRGIGGAGITLYADQDFRGFNSTFRADVPDLRKYGMNDRVDSLRVARGEIWEACENINYKGRCQVFTGDETNLNRVGWGGMISSLRRLKEDDRRGQAGGSFPSFAARPRLVLFDDVGFRGQSFVLNAADPALRALGNRARSAKVYGGDWELCDGDRFRGHCATVGNGVADLGRLGLRDKISSARPVGRNR